MRTIAEGALTHERILVATALDAASSSVLEAAVAPFMDARKALALCHVRDEPERYLDAALRGEERRALDEAARQRLELWSAGCLRPYPRELLVEAAGLPIDGIARAAERWGPDLIAVGASSVSGFLSRLIGAVSDRVVRQVGVDVLVARVSPASSVVLAATDLSDPSFAAIAMAAEEARRRAGSLVVLHVADGSVPFFAESDDAPGYEQRTEARSWVEHAVARTGMHAAVEIDEGPAVQRIVARARDVRAELLVVASHGRTGLTRVLLGSAAEDLTRESPCSVLVVRR